MSGSFEATLPAARILLRALVMIPPSDRDVLRRLHELGPFSDDGAALTALHTTLQAVGGALTEDERRAVAAALPPECARVLLGARATGCRRSNDLFLELALHEKVSIARAVEHAEIVCQALGEVLSSTARARLRHAVPDIAKLFEERLEATASQRPPYPRHDAPNYFAEGRPGGSRPLASANPAELAHRHSVARSDDPHAETKLSSACGLTQEREERTLSSGTPGSRRPLSKGR
jgi:uncharacterized protein (DUF2267 family)